MTKNAYTYTKVWNGEDSPDFFELPDKCLSYTIENKGTDVIEVSKSVKLAQNEEYPVEHHVGYFHAGVVELHPVTRTEKLEVHFRITVEG